MIVFYLFHISHINLVVNVRLRTTIQVAAHTGAFFYFYTLFWLLLVNSVCDDLWLSFGLNCVNVRKIYN